MKIHILTCFPDYFSGTFCSLLGRATKEGKLQFNIIDIKKYGIGRYSRIDEKPAGGGSGLIMRADVIEKALLDNFNIEEFIDNPKKQIILPSPRGKRFTQKTAGELAKIDEIIFLCNRYEGIDQRAIEYFKMRQICVGEYILMGGETATMCIIEASCRLIDGILGNPESIKNETFSGTYQDNIECDQYTQPREWNGLKIPEVLLSGHHGKIAEWRKEKQEGKKNNKTNEVEKFKQKNQ